MEGGGGGGGGGVTPWLIAAPPREANTVTPVMTAEVPEASGDLIGTAQARGA